MGCMLISVFTEWYTLTNKEKYCGEVYVEMTFWSNVSDSLFIMRLSYSNLAVGEGPCQKAAV